MPCRSLRSALIAGLWLMAAEAAVAAPSGLLRIIIDGQYDDWRDAPPLFDAAARQDGDESGTTVERLWFVADRERFYLRFTLPREVILQRDSGLVLYLDTDASAATGWLVEGLGAEIRWSFGERRGRAMAMGLPLAIAPAAIGLRQAPTHAAHAFELAFDRRSSVAGAPIFPSDRIGVLLRLEHGSRPFSTGPLFVRCDDAATAPPPAAPGADLSLARLAPFHLRILAYNVLFDGCFERPEAFGRLLRAIDADIVSLQEIFNHSAQQAQELFERFFPGQHWHAAGDDRGIILSRYPVRDSGPIGAHRRGGWALIAAPLGDVLIINPHPPCCDDDPGRQREFDAIAAWLRDRKAAGALPPATPIVIAGDMNLVGDSRQLRTLLAGEIVDTATHGAPQRPDWDDTALADAMPYHLTGREVYTWRNDAGPFAPGRLDYLVYTDSVLGLGRRFVLWTADLPDAFLQAHGLERDDTAVASDHLPVVGDFYRRQDSSR